MQTRNLVAIGAALVLALIAVFLLNSYFSGYEAAQEQTAEEQQMARIVVASQDLTFGETITSTNSRLVNWPGNSVPTGAFSTLEGASQGGRVALRPMVAGEPILSSKVSGEGGRATLSSILPEDRRAISIPVNAVAGVGGFVRAGDVVDVMLTRQIPGDGATSIDKMTTVVLENTLVLAIDQIADENNTEAAIANTATLQTDAFGAQKLALATQLGTLSLALRNVENQVVGESRAVLPRDLGGEGIFIADRSNRAATVARSAPARTQQTQPTQNTAVYRPSGPSMTVVRGVESEQYQVNRNVGN
ncbi:Flp pilus assembly protein CpaB [Erythrobacter sp. MTPC3]|uniref:Flp pilus assembly protein CpaB n=1 Tax=Erythrobacter sp. MTPC3 TaxID=3056564 RepID=UPI0036F30257